MSATTCPVRLSQFTSNAIYLIKEKVIHTIEPPKMQH